MYLWVNPSRRGENRPPGVVPRRRRAAAGFSFVEILIVVAILGILAAIVVPRFSSASDTSRESATKLTVYRIRQQLEIYKQQHAGHWPSLANFEQQMTRASNASGQTAPPGTAGYPLGPYLQAVPVNPYTETNDVSDGPVGTSAWYYDQDTGDFRANNSAEARSF